jgi:hypothetical protein
MKRFNDLMAGEFLAGAITAAPLAPRAGGYLTDEFLASTKVWRATKIYLRKNFTHVMIAQRLEALLNQRMRQRGLKPMRVSARQMLRTIRRVARQKGDAEVCRMLDVKSAVIGRFIQERTFAAPQNESVISITS